MERPSPRRLRRACAWRELRQPENLARTLGVHAGLVRPCIAIAISGSCPRRVDHCQRAHRTLPMGQWPRWLSRPAPAAASGALATAHHSPPLTTVHAESDATSRALGAALSTATPLASGSAPASRALVAHRDGLSYLDRPARVSHRGWIVVLRLPDVRVRTS